LFIALVGGFDACFNIIQYYFHSHITEEFFTPSMVGKPLIDKAFHADLFVEKWCADVWFRGFFIGK